MDPPWLYQLNNIFILVIYLKIMELLKMTIKTEPVDCKFEECIFIKSVTG